MEIAAPYYRSTLLPILRQLQQGKPKFTRAPNSAIPMSQGFHHDIFGFADGLDRPMQPDQSVHQDPRTTSIYNQTAAAAASGNMLSEMFNFSPSITATDLLANQISAGYVRFQQDPPVATPLMASHDWYGGTANIENAVNGTGGLGLGQLRDMAAAAKHNNAQALPPGLNADSASAMQLYLMNPPPSSVTQAAPRSHSPSSTTPQALPLNHDFIAAAAAVGSSFAGGVGEGQGLSLSLSSSMQQFDIEKAEELRARNGLYYYNNQLQHQLQGQQSQHFSQQSQVGFSGHQIGTMNILRHSKYTKAAQELLEEFCSVGRGQLMKGKKGKRQSSSSQFGGSGGGGGASSSSSKDPPVPSQSPSDRFEHQIRRKAKLLSMLVEVDRRYNHYCEQMQMVVNSFDTIMGFGAATPYTGLAQKAMSRHFRCLKDNIAAQLKHTCELLGEKDTGIGSGITKGETPRLKLLDQNLRQQRSFHQMGMMEQEAWRPQRGLPERSVNALRAWLFEHFLHPYPSDADKHLLARQTGLTRNQVSNWFINARVRLWKPMVEEMYLQESKEEENKEREDQTSESLHKQKHHQLQQSQRPPAESSGTKSTGAAENKNVHSHHLTPMSIPKQQLHQPFSSPSSSENPLSVSSSTNVGALPGMELLPPARVSNISGMNPESMIGYGPGTQVRFGTHGDVSLTLGLRQTGNMPDQNNRFSLRDFNGR